MEQKHRKERSKYLPQMIGTDLLKTSTFRCIFGRCWCLLSLHDKIFNDWIPERLQETVREERNSWTRTDKDWRHWLYFALLVYLWPFVAAQKEFVKDLFTSLRWIWSFNFSYSLFLSSLYWVKRRKALWLKDPCYWMTPQRPRSIVFSATGP